MIFIAGATGFTGSLLIEALKEKGYKVRCLVRTSRKAEACKRLGFEALRGDITDRDSLRGVLKEVDMAVHLVGIIEETPGLTFESVHVEGTRNLISEAKEAGIKHFFYQSALGASLSSGYRYQKTKALAEEIVKASGLPYTIFRPSLIVGKGDGFTERIKKLIEAGPIVPVPGTGKARFQPIYIEDWVKCLLKIIDNPEAVNRVYEFGGPEHLTYNEILKMIMESMEVKKKVVHLPLKAAIFGLPFAAALNRIFTLGMPTATSEQLRLLEKDNICSLESVKTSFGFEPMRFADALKLFISQRARDR